MPQEVIVATLDEINDPGSKGFSLNVNDTTWNLFVVKKNAQLTVYKNACPHTQGPLDWTPDQFLDLNHEYIMCANHGALFEIDTGLCIYGPCKKQSLVAIPFTVKNNQIYLQI